MIDGYDSTVTISAGLRNVLLVWTLPGLGLIAAGLAGLLVGNDSSLVTDSFGDFAVALRIGTGLLSLVTIITSIVWAVRTWSNIRRVGKRAKVGAWDVIKRHLVFMVASVFFFVMGLITQSVAILVFAGLLLYLAMSFVSFLILAMVRLFWRTGSPPIGLEEDLPHYGLVWFSTWLLFSSFAGAGEYKGFSIQLASLLTIGTGFCCTVAAVTGAKLVGEISRRHDERLAAIIDTVDLDPDARPEVTSQQIESAWNSSESLVSFDSVGGH